MRDVVRDGVRRSAVGVIIGVGVFADVVRGFGGQEHPSRAGGDAGLEQAVPRRQEIHHDVAQGCSCTRLEAIQSARENRGRKTSKSVAQCALGTRQAGRQAVPRRRGGRQRKQGARAQHLKQNRS